MASVEGKCMKANKKAFFKRFFSVFEKAAITGRRRAPGLRQVPVRFRKDNKKVYLSLSRSAKKTGVEK